MRSRKLIASIVVLIIFALLAGCTGMQIRISDQNKSIKVTDVDFSKGRTVSGSASGFQLLLLIPININDRHERALQMLRDAAGDDYITDVKIQESWAYAFIGTIYTTNIQAKAYPVKRS